MLHWVYMTKTFNNKEMAIKTVKRLNSSDINEHIDIIESVLIESQINARSELSKYKTAYSSLYENYEYTVESLEGYKKTCYFLIACLLVLTLLVLFGVV